MFHLRELWIRCFRLLVVITVAIQSASPSNSSLSHDHRNTDVIDLLNLLSYISPYAWHCQRSNVPCVSGSTVICYAVMYVLFLINLMNKQAASLNRAIETVYSHTFLCARNFGLLPVQNLTSYSCCLALNSYKGDEIYRLSRLIFEI